MHMMCFRAFSEFHRGAKDSYGTAHPREYLSLHGENVLIYKRFQNFPEILKGPQKIRRNPEETLENPISKNKKITIAMRLQG